MIPLSDGTSADELEALVYEQAGLVLARRREVYEEWFKSYQERRRQLATVLVLRSLLRANLVLQSALEVALRRSIHLGVVEVKLGGGIECDRRLRIEVRGVRIAEDKAFVQVL